MNIREMESEQRRRLLRRTRHPLAFAKDADNTFQFEPLMTFFHGEEDGFDSSETISHRLAIAFILFIGIWGLLVIAFVCVHHNLFR